MDCGLNCGMKVLTLIYCYFQYFVSVVKILLSDPFVYLIESLHHFAFIFSPLKRTSIFHSFYSYVLWDQWAMLTEVLLVITVVYNYF